MKNCVQSQNSSRFVELQVSCISVYKLVNVRSAAWCVGCNASQSLRKQSDCPVDGLANMTSFVGDALSNQSTSFYFNSESSVDRWFTGLRRCLLAPMRSDPLIFISVGRKDG
jgi:hypothetical protein